MSVLRRINTKAPKNRGNKIASREFALDCGLFAVLLFALSVHSFWNMNDMDGLMFLTMALLCGSELLLKKQLLRQGTVSVVACTLFALLIGCAAAMGDNTVITAMLALFLPVIAISICGIKYGMIIGGSFAIYIAVLLYSPVVSVIPAEYPAVLQTFYPVLYGLVCVVCFMHSYSDHKQKLIKYRNEETLEKAVKAEHDKLMSMTMGVW